MSVITSQSLHIRTNATPPATSSPNTDIDNCPAPLLSTKLMGEGVLLVVDALPVLVVPFGKVVVPLSLGMMCQRLLRVPLCWCLTYCAYVDAKSMQSMARVR